MQQRSLLITVMLSALSLTACGKAAVSSPATNSTEPASASETTSDTPAAAPSDHQYAFVEGDSYGYQPAISKNDEDQGMKTPALTIFRFAGVDNGQYTLVSKMDGSTGAFSCAKPCRFIKTQSLDDPTDTAVTAFEASTLMGAAMTDAMAGKLKVSAAAAAELAQAKSAATQATSSSDQ